MFSFFCRGMPFVDVIYLQKHSLCDGVLGYARHKTGQWLQVALTPRLQTLIDKYACPSSPYVFASLCGEDEWQLRCQYRTVLERVNRNLKRLGRLCSIATPLTTYVARHTWATLAKGIGYSRLGHQRGTGPYHGEDDAHLPERVRPRGSWTGPTNWSRNCDFSNRGILAANVKSYFCTRLYAI